MPKQKKYSSADRCFNDEMPYVFDEDLTDEQRKELADAYAEHQRQVKEYADHLRNRQTQ